MYRLIVTQSGQPGTNEAATMNSVRRRAFVISVEAQIMFDMVANR